MKCPQCGTEFEAVVSQCFTCGWDFNDDPADFNPQRSKLAVASLVLGILCLFTLYVPLLATIIIGSVAIRKIRKSRRRLTGQRLAMAGILVPLLSVPVMLTIGYAVWSKDAPPVPNEFTEADLIQVRPENEASWEVLLKLCDNRYGSDEISAMGLNSEDERLLSQIYSEIIDENNSAEEIHRNVSDNQQQIHLLWEKSKKGREVILQLAKYDQIAELPDLEAEPWPEFVMNLGSLHKVYSLYVLSTSHQADQEVAIDEFIQFNKVIRSLCVYSRVLITKMTCLSCVDKNLKIMAFLINDIDIPKGIIDEIAVSFQPITNQHLSLKNHIVSQYLSVRDMQKKFLEDPMVDVKPVYKRNSTNRYNYSLCKNIILRDEGKQASSYCDISVWPWESPNWPKLYFVDEQCYEGSLYYSYNPVGVMSLTLLNKDLLFGDFWQKKTQFGIRDDLFQWVLAQRTGQEGSLKARAYSDEYTVDIEKGLIFSVGQDGQAYTDDDIKLQIDPAVLGLK